MNFTLGAPDQDYENELILPRGSRYLITKVEDKGEYRLYWSHYLHRPWAQGS